MRCFVGVLFLQMCLVGGTVRVVKDLFFKLPLRFQMRRTSGFTSVSSTAVGEHLAVMIADEAAEGLSLADSLLLDSGAFCHGGGWIVAAEGLGSDKPDESISDGLGELGKEIENLHSSVEALVYIIHRWSAFADNSQIYK
jgi:hypothetical protein